MRTYEIHLIHPTESTITIDADWFDMDEHNNLVLWKSKGGNGETIATIVNGIWGQIKDLSVYGPTP